MAENKEEMEAYWRPRIEFFLSEVKRIAEPKRLKRRERNLRNALRGGYTSESIAEIRAIAGS